MPEAPAEFVELARGAGIEFDPGDLDRLSMFLALMLDENTRQNLTAITDPAEAWMRHILDALTLLPVLAGLAPEEPARVIDVGSGCGVPGIPLAICMPQHHFTLLEATGKKARFLAACARSLGLSNVEVLAERAEVAGQDRGARAGTGSRRGAKRESFDAAIARAVGPMNVVAELTVPFVRVGGTILLIKGQRAEEELAQAGEALRTLGARHEATISTPTGRLVVLAKERPTPANYPRRDGEPKRAPLGVHRGKRAGGEA